MISRRSDLCQGAGLLVLVTRSAQMSTQRPACPNSFFNVAHHSSVRFCCRLMRVFALRVSTRWETMRVRHPGSRSREGDICSSFKFIWDIYRILFIVTIPTTLLNPDMFNPDFRLNRTDWKVLIPSHTFNSYTHNPDFA